MNRREMLKALSIATSAGAVGIFEGASDVKAQQALKTAFPSASFPETEIYNGLIRAKIYLPDQALGYYRSTRFDWAGVISELEYKGHSYFGEWFEKHDPSINDAITGPVEEFNPIGFAEAKPGENFLKIGVGILQKINDKPYHFSVPYGVVNQGSWTSTRKRDQVKFVHKLNDPSGYYYLYHKTLKLVKGKPELILKHTLKNTGEKKISTKVYNHNFFMLDKQKIGPDYTVEFPFDISLIKYNRGLGFIAEIQENKIKFLRDVQKGESVQMFLEGFDQNSKDYHIQIKNSKAGSGVRISSDQPISELAFWCMENTLCPEPYIKVEVDPGNEFSWQIHYEFLSS